MNRTLKRIVFSSVLLISVYIFPWYISSTLGILGMFIFANYIEGIIAGVLIDLVYGTTGFLFGSVAAIFSVGFILAFFIIEKLKSRLRIYAV